MKKDVSDKKYMLKDIPHINRCNNFLEEYVVPEYIAFYIATGYYHNSFWEGSFIQHFNSALDIFCYDLKNQEQTINLVLKILEKKYCLKFDITSPRLKANPL